MQGKLPADENMRVCNFHLEDEFFEQDLEVTLQVQMSLANLARKIFDSSALKFFLKKN